MLIAGPNRLAQRIATLAGIVATTVLLAACASGTGTNALDVARNATQGPTPPITLAPIIGAPPNVSKSLSSKIASVAADRSVTVVGSGDKTAAYTLRGYIATSPEAAKHKLSYIWDVTDKSGKRVHRITGEEVVPAKPGGNPWASIQDQTLQKIAVSTIGNLATWLPTQSTGVTPVAAPASPRKPAPQRPQETRPREILALVPDVKGAPGDGNKSLTRALKGHLQKKGVKLASNSGAGVYTVSGSVAVGKASGGQQTIQIDWKVRDPRTGKERTVSQKNTIPQGSLDGQWGDIANAAASAAAKEIVKLLPRTSN